MSRAVELYSLKSNLKYKKGNPSKTDLLSGSIQEGVQYGRWLWNVLDTKTIDVKDKSKKVRGMERDYRFTGLIL